MKFLPYIINSFIYQYYIRYIQTVLLNFINKPYTSSSQIKDCRNSVLYASTYANNIINISNSSQVLEYENKLNNYKQEINKNLGLLKASYTEENNLLNGYENAINDWIVLADKAIINYKSSNEIGNLADATRSSINNLREYVAGNVKDLAAQSMEAVKSTAELIQGSTRAVENGTKIADDTAKSLASIIESINQSLTLVNQIANASSEQAFAISQVKQSVEQIANVVQTNSNTAEESALSTQELFKQSDLLKTLINNFKLSED